MKVLLINGSPKVNGCTYTALYEVAKELEKENIETEKKHRNETIEFIEGFLKEIENM